ncbi:flippase [Fulvivirgaceae bacterium PWU4]|uniref:Flippase n=1 Tax=Chryseosolibacter histidini TaxID=2782349 RepID=A0AAP2DPU6_9BACT|nr:flippase [Chryseosolibacter histidini]MBT1700335.1 flippase [Chryseosolibacter histidini]
MELIRKLLGLTWSSFSFVPPRIQRYLQNVSWLLFEKVFTFFIAMVVSVYVARYLQPEQFGLLSYAISFAGILSVITVSTDQVIVRELARYPEKKNVLLGTSFTIKLASSLLIFVVIAVILFFMDNSRLTNSLILIVAAAELFKAFEVISCYYQAQVLSRQVVKAQIFINFMVSIVKIGLVYLEAPLMWFALIVPIGAAANAAGFVYIYRKGRSLISAWKFSRADAYLFLREAWPLALFGLALNTQTRIDQVMLGKLMTASEVGQYSVAVRLLEVLGFIPMVLSNTFTPPIAKAKAISQNLYHERLINLYRLMFASFLFFAIPIFLIGDDVVRILYGPAYSTAGFLLSLFSVRLFFMHLGMAKSIFILNEGLFKYSLLTAIVGAALNIAINMALIPRYGSIGAFIAMLISFTVSFFMDVFFTRMRMNLGLIMTGITSFWKLRA